MCPHCNYQRGGGCCEEKNIIYNIDSDGKIKKKGEISENGCVFVINGLKLKGLFWNDAAVAKEFEPRNEPKGINRHLMIFFNNVAVKSNF